MENMSSCVVAGLDIYYCPMAQGKETCLSGKWVLLIIIYNWYWKMQNFRSQASKYFLVSQALCGILNSHYYMFAIFVATILLSSSDLFFALQVSVIFEDNNYVCEYSWFHMINRANHWGLITVTSHDGHGVLKHQQHCWLFHHLFRCTSKLI